MTHEASDESSTEAAAGLVQTRELAQSSLNQIEAIATNTRAVAAELEETLRRVQNLLIEVETKHSETGGVVAAVNEAKAQIVAAQSIIAEKSGFIEDARRHAETTKSALEQFVSAAEAQQAEAEAQRKRAQQAADAAVQRQNEAKGAKVAGDADVASIRKALEGAISDAAKAKALGDHADAIETSINAYESRLNDLGDQAAARLAEITGLLPGATSAGLASAFDKRRQSFLDPAKRWQWVFVGSIIALALLAIFGVGKALLGGEVLTYQQVLTLWLERLPIAGALIWLALHSSRESALAKRLEEDYGYKAAVASSFQGFLEQMKQLGADASSGTPLAKLCEDTLRTIGSPPGDIYAKHALNVKPTKEILDALRGAGGDQLGKT